MRITVYDGKDCIGGNKIYVQIDDKTGFFFDFGNNFSTSDKYFHDYLVERSVGGINTYVELDMIPKLNIYRADLIPADLDVSSFKNVPVQAVLLSHAHADHAGMIGLLREDIAVVASPLSLALLKSFKDTGQTYLGSDFTYFKQRIPSDDDGFVLEPPRNATPVWRPLYATGEADDTFYEFMRASPYARAELPEPDIRSADELPFDVKAIPVDHSIPGAVGFIVEADETIAYTGDFRFHGTHGGDTERFIKEAKKAGVSTLIIEGTRVSRENDHYVSEEDVQQAINAEFSERDGPLFVNFNGNDLDRLRTVAEAAKKNGRTLLITEKLLYKLLAANSAGYSCSLDGIKVLLPFASSTVRAWQKNLRDAYPDLFVTIPDVRNRLEEYVIYLNYYNVKDLADIRPDGGTYVHSASEAFGEEQEFDFVRMSNWLKHYKIEIVGFEMRYDRMLGRERPFFVGNFHASGHASAEEIARTVDVIDPDRLIPVHTLERGWFYERWDGKVKS
ncbi:MAG: ribonuclease [Candidatus Diapherotrites archaeon]|nr:ribonuclease [Candidatus Diapherotrites archaeon]MDN5367129.1 ribonuclease [Candidatus Diapherotrites archaeon]